MVFKFKKKYENTFILTDSGTPRELTKNVSSFLLTNKINNHLWIIETLKIKILNKLN